VPAARRGSPAAMDGAAPYVLREYRRGASPPGFYVNTPAGAARLPGCPAARLYFNPNSARLLAVAAAARAWGVMPLISASFVATSET